MKLNTQREVWIARIIAWLILGALSAGIIFGTTFMFGPGLFAVPGLSDRIAVMVYCPGAESTSIEEGASTQTTSDPSGPYGHTVEVTCHYADGSTKVIDNGQFAAASIGGMFGLGALCGLVITIPIMLAPLFVIRKKRT